jgi:hypothetical protein
MRACLAVIHIDAPAMRHSEGPTVIFGSPTLTCTLVAANLVRSQRRSGSAAFPAKAEGPFVLFPAAFAMPGR